MRISSISQPTLVTAELELKDLFKRTWGNLKETGPGSSHGVHQQEHGCSQQNKSHPFARHFQVHPRASPHAMIPHLVVIASRCVGGRSSSPNEYDE